MVSPKFAMPDENRARCRWRSNDGYMLKAVEKVGLEKEKVSFVQFDTAGQPERTMRCWGNRPRPLF